MPVAPLDGARARRHRVYEAMSSRLDLRVSSGTYVRAIAEALGGHCAHAAPDGGRAVHGRGGRPVSGSCRPDEALARIGLAPEGAAGSCLDEGRRRSLASWRLGRGRSRLGHVRRRPPRPPARCSRRAVDCAGAHADGGDLLTRIRGRCSATRCELLTTLERRLELLAEAGVEETLVVEFTPELAALAPDAVRGRAAAADRDRGSWSRG
mgnify:CR=1 FL=1